MRRTKYGYTCWLEFKTDKSLDRQMKNKKIKSVKNEVKYYLMNNLTKRQVKKVLRQLKQEI